MSLIFMSLAASSFNNNQSNTTNSGAGNIKEEKTTYESDGKTYEAYITWDESKEGKRPGILILPEWWGLNDYSRSRAKQLAELGYVAMALDVYGDGKTGDNPDDASKL
ncbi:MAG: dienelactone hydrolase family protein, partial [Ginsengibacter sp.]